ncbi:hypothetical protein BCR36DRAFT_588376, partial [Piromyces finnis]
MEILQVTLLTLVPMKKLIQINVMINVKLVLLNILVNVVMIANVYLINVIKNHCVYNDDESPIVHCCDVYSDKWFL